MPSQFTVEKVVGEQEWESAHGKMIEWNLICRDLATDRSGPVSINSTPKNSYAAGQTFWAEHVGLRNGQAKLKRVSPPPGAVAQPQPFAVPASKEARLPVSTGASYEQAIEIYKRIAADLDGYEHTYVTTVFLGWLNGKIAAPNPIHPEDQTEPF